MRVAIPHWQGRISPVFDVAGNVLLVDVADSTEHARENLAVDAAGPQARVNLLAQHGATVLICGAISSPVEMALAAAGIEVISQTCGDVEQVLAAYINGQWNPETFLMPGCCGRRRRFQAGRRRGGRCWRRGQEGGDNDAQR